MQSIRTTPISLRERCICVLTSLDRFQSTLPRVALTTHLSQNLTILQVEAMMSSLEASSVTNKALTFPFEREMDTMYVAASQQKIGRKRLLGRAI